MHQMQKWGSKATLSLLWNMPDTQKSSAASLIYAFNLCSGVSLHKLSWVCCALNVTECMPQGCLLGTSAILSSLWKCPPETCSGRTSREEESPGSFPHRGPGLPVPHTPWFSVALTQALPVPHLREGLYLVRKTQHNPNFQAAKKATYSIKAFTGGKATHIMVLWHPSQGLSSLSDLSPALSTPKGTAVPFSVFLGPQSSSPNLFPRLSFLKQSSSPAYSSHCYVYLSPVSKYWPSQSNSWLWGCYGSIFPHLSRSLASLSL